jgi:hypothetical protein
MHLRRKSHHGHFYEQECSEFTPSRSSDDVEKSTAHLDFDKFGEGTDNFSWFQIIASWPDVEALIEEFAKLGHPVAVRLQRAEQLATAVESLTKNSN